MSTFKIEDSFKLKSKVSLKGQKVSVEFNMNFTGIPVEIIRSSFVTGFGIHIRSGLKGGLKEATPENLKIIEARVRRMVDKSNDGQIAYTDYLASTSDEHRKRAQVVQAPVTKESIIAASASMSDEDINEAIKALTAARKGK